MTRFEWALVVFTVVGSATLLATDLVPPPDTKLVALLDVEQPPGPLPMEDFRRAARAIADRGAAFDGADDALAEIEAELEAVEQLPAGPDRLRRVDALARAFEVRRLMLEAPMDVPARLAEELDEYDASERAEARAMLDAQQAAADAPPDHAALLADLESRIAKLR
ncbi:MAG: hypothetical protein AAGD14_01960 [Planctomycetota bacterium]